VSQSAKTSARHSTANSTTSSGGRPDRLSALLERFRIRAQVHPVGKDVDHGVGGGVGGDIGGDIGDTGDGAAGGMAANLFLIGDDAMEAVLHFYPRGGVGPHGASGSGTVRATVDAGGASPITLALPERVEVRLTEAPALAAVADILIDEARAPRCGRRAVVDRLCEVVVIRLLRHLIENGEAEAGLLAGLAHPNLAPALVAIHENPEKTLGLEDLAVRAAMSRTHFANTFRDVVGMTPGQYLTDWRLTLARLEIAGGAPVKTVAKRVGFSGAAALSRAFTRRFGLSPRQLRAGTPSSVS